MAAPLLAVRDLTLAYGAGNSAMPALHRVSFDIQRGDRFVILGRSGCGKSTLLKAIAGFLPPRSGKIELAGKAITAPGIDRMVVWQDANQLLPWKRVLDNVAYPLLRNGVAKGEARERARAFLDKVDLNRALDLYPHQLSGGMKMRVAIARALAVEPVMLLLDEPFSALDALTRSRLQDELLQLQRQSGTTLLFVTHDIPEAVKLGSAILVLSPHPGQIKALLDPARVSPEELSQTISRLIHADSDDSEQEPIG